MACGHCAHLVNSDELQTEENKLKKRERKVEGQLRLTMRRVKRVLRYNKNLKRKLSNRSANFRSKMRALKARVAKLKKMRGPRGYRGKRGARGARGRTGKQGPTGATGARGPRGTKGRRGATGATGPKGVSGAAGPAGPRGRPGRTGRPGATGAKGRQGQRGPRGPRGRPGRKGRPGRTGPAGKTGRTGPRGFTGRKGGRGPRGASRRGSRGPRGIRGSTGPRGRPGKRGPRGLRGSRGPRGRRVVVKPKRPVLKGMRTFFTTKYTGGDGRDHGYVNHRSLRFHKKVTSSSVRLMYYDNMRVYQHRRHGASCRWEIRVDHRHCPSGRIAGDAYIWAAANIHRPREIMGYCRNIRKGWHTAQVYVSPTPGYRADCYTGWYSQQTSWTLEATEVPANSRKKGLSFVTKYTGGDGRDHGWVNHRILRFFKNQGGTAMRLTYNDNLRTHARGGGHSCRWNLMVDNRHCPSGNIGGDAYIWGAANNHRPRVITGYCSGLKRGWHHLRVFVQQTPGYRGSDCYTGWYTQQTSWTLEAEEIRPGRGSRRHYFVTAHPGPDGRDQGYVRGRNLHFQVKRGRPVRLLYYDNLRTYTPHHRGKSCRWEIRVDNRHCPSGRIAGDAYVYFRKNSHRPRTIVGYCRGLKKGHHTARVYVSPTPG